MRPTSRFRLAALLAALTGLAGCEPEQVELAEDILLAQPDADADGWFTAERNQRASLAVIGIGFGIPPAVTVDDRIAGWGGTPVIGDTPLATRVIGTWLTDETDEIHTFASRIIVDGVPATVHWTNEDREFTETIGIRPVTFRSSVETFADPNPLLADRDDDDDAMTEEDEGRLALRSDGRIGDPGRRDLLMVVGFTHPDWAMTRNAREKVTTAFRAEDINLYIEDGTDGIDDFLPGQILPGGVPPGRNHELRLAEVASIRGDHIPGFADPFAHLLVFAAQAVEADGDPLWGQANRPGYNLTATWALPAIGPDAFDYQAKDVMHELGHNLGLCHPEASDGTDGCAEIPEEERNSATSVMGTPAEAQNIVETLSEALSRPLDYSPAQWTELQF